MRSKIEVSFMRWQWGWVTFPVAVIVAGCGIYGGSEHKEAEHSGEQEAHVTVRTAVARRGMLTEVVEGLGRCEALPDHIATLTPAVEGHVHELLVVQGDTVKKGQPIVELDRAVAQADLAEKTATRDGLKASLALLKSIPRPAERRANELAVEQAKVAVEQAKAALDQLRPLRARHEVSEQQIFVAQKALEQATIQQATAEAQLRVMLIGPRPEAIAEAEGKIKTADAQVAFSQAHLDYHTIHAPIDGMLEDLTCHPGQTIAIGSPIGEVVDTRQVYASIWLPSRSASSVQVGLTARVRPGDDHFRVASSTDAAEEAMVGKVTFVGRVADPQTGSLPVRVLVENPQGRLTIGQSVQVSIIVEERKSVLQVPVAAVLDLGEGPVFSVVRDGKSVMLHPEVRTPHQGWMEIAGTDLKEGEAVIIEGGYNLPENTPVAVAQEKADAQEEAGAKGKVEAKEKAGALAKEDDKAEAKEKSK
jgi:multidrug efflux pump subunit AcrA (membrane-fusion protein)